MAESRADGPVVAVIPARGGSKRIPRKNIRPFLGVPLLGRTIGILREAGIFDSIVVSTDDAEIADIARRAGAEVPFRRPAHLSDDHTGTRPVVEHAIRHLEAIHGKPLGPVCCAYPTAVFLESSTIAAGLDLLLGDGTDKVMTATAFAAPIQRAFRRTASGHVEMIWPVNAQVRSQDLEVTYHDVGQLYWARREVWLDQVREPRVRILELDRRRVQDIDTLEDWETAEFVFKLLQLQQQRSRLTGPASSDAQGGIQTGLD